MTCGPSQRTSTNDSTDYAFGGGAGMVMMIEPIGHREIKHLKAQRTYDEKVIYISPDGDLLDQPMRTA